ncbi:hypothetical protein A4A49_04016 [Nicotiana attenuata]|uniref:Signal recognition particle subunit SRP72 n=1 Tax=Nicotiana attenuata TaxID=49451 RepID=A0A1J6HXX2_NICAT|nr:hypothetical protein A4A49_04016 [Nicotiana attenuata]
MAPKPKDKPKGSPATVGAVGIEDLFTSLNRHIQRSEYEQSVKVSDQILAVAPGDEDAIRCKVVALIKADSIDEALVAIQESKKAAIDLSFFKAYCLYRQNKLDQALESLKGQEGSTASMLLESQILYRLGKMEASVDIYQKLQKSQIDSLEINLVAGLVSAGRASDVQGTLDSIRVKATNNFELAYNTACSLMRGRSTRMLSNCYCQLEGRRFLKLIIYKVIHVTGTVFKIGQETLMEENLADDEVEIELAPIAVQLAYVQQILANTQEAVASYTNLVKRNLADEPSLAVAVNNLIALKGPKDVSDGLRKLDKLVEKSDGPEKFQLARGLDLKLSQKQREAIYTNRMLLLLHSNKMDQARELVAVLPDLFPGSLMPVLLQAAVHVRENKAGKAEEILGHFADKFPDKCKVILLARAQVAAAAGHPQIAAESLAKIPDIQHKPATVATLVSLKERQEILMEAAAFKLRHGRKEAAARLYEELVKSHGSIEALVGLIQTAAHGNVEKAEAYEKQLKPLPGLKSIDVDSLEKTSGAKHVETVPNVGVTEPKSKDKAKQKRKRKPKYPKGFDPANPGPPPHPERWLPKRERSSYRPKRKDKRAAQIRGSQGAVTKEAAISNDTKSNQPANSKVASQNASTEQSKPSSKSRKKSRK